MVAHLTETEIIDAFKNDFQKIKEMNFVESKRPHNTGIGKTFEDLIGINENNYQLVDYMGFLELKSQRELTKAPLTLYSKSPNYPDNVNVYLRKEYGKWDEEYPKLKVLQTQFSGLDENVFNERWGFKLFFNNEREKLFITVRDLETDTIVHDSTYYTYQTLKCRVEGKCQNIAYVNAKSKNTNGKEEFKFLSAKLLTGLTFDKFVKAVNDGIIVYDIRCGITRTGKDKGKLHDHGSGFRIKKENFSKVFTVTDL